MNDTKAVRYEQEIPDLVNAIAHIHQTMDVYGFDRTIKHLVELRASQINACGFCIKMHVREAREDGETSDRLDRMVVWRQMRDFSDRERAALAWTEALTVLDANTNYGELRAELRKNFSEKEISVLTAIVAMINLWNRINISKY